LSAVYQVFKFSSYQVFQFSGYSGNFFATCLEGDAVFNNVDLENLELEGM